MRQWILLAAVVGWVAGGAWGGPLFSDKPQEMRSEVFASIDPDKAVPTEIERYSPLVGMVRATVIQQGWLVTSSPASDATTVQREEMAEYRVKQLQEYLTSKIVGQGVSGSLVVLDVLDDPQEITEGEQPGKVWEGRRMVIGRISMPGEDYSDAAKAAIARINRDAQEKIEAASKADRRDRKEITLARAKIDRERKSALDQIRREDAMYRPFHTVYLIGSPKEFGDWRRGQTKPFKGVIQRAGIFREVVNFTKMKEPRPILEGVQTYAGMEFIVIAAGK